MRIVGDQVGLPALAIGGFTALILIGTGLAQEVTRGQTLPDTGISAGALLLFPEISAETEYDDNITFAEDDKRSDVVARVAGSVTAQTQWSRHAFQTDIFGEVERFADNDDADAERFGGRVSGRLDVSRAMTVDGAATVERDALARRDSDNEGQLEPREFNRYSGEVGFRYRPNRIGVEIDLTLDRRDFVDAADDDQDREQIGIRTRLSYETAPGFDLFVEPFARFEDFDELQNGVDRDRQTYGALVGSRIDLTGALAAEAGVGLFRESFEDDQFDDRTSLGLDGAVDWEVSRRTRLRGQATRQDVATTVDGAASKVATSVGLRATHEVTEELTAAFDAEYRNESFEGISREDNDFRAGIAAEFELTRRLFAGARYEFSTRDSSEDGSSFTNNTATVRLTGRF